MRLLAVFLLLAASLQATITLDATSGGTYTGSGTETWAHTCTGTNLILLVGVWSRTTDGLTGVTYNGVAMTLAAKNVAITNSFAYLFYLIAPATGTHNIVVSSTVEMIGSAISYTGASQTVQPDAIANDSSATTVGSTVSLPITVVHANSLAVGVWTDSGMGGFSQIGLGDTGFRRLVMVESNGSMFDSKVVLSPGTFSFVITHGGSGFWAAAAMSIADASVSASSPSQVGAFIAGP